MTVEVSADDEDNHVDEDMPLTAADTTMYRAVAAGINLLSQDRAELLFAAKEVSRHMTYSSVVSKESVLICFYW